MAKTFYTYTYNYHIGLFTQKLKKAQKSKVVYKGGLTMLEECFKKLLYYNVLKAGDSKNLKISCYGKTYLITVKVTQVQK